MIPENDGKPRSENSGNITETVYLIKPGELTLKKGNCECFEQILRRNLETMLHARVRKARLRTNAGRLYIHLSPDDTQDQNEQTERTEAVLGKLAGISGWAKTRVTEKTVEAVMAACAAEGAALAGRGIQSFKVAARRADKSFPLSSYEICCAAGDAVTKTVPGLAVNVKSPQGIISVEIREKAYIYGKGKKGLRGLPAGSAGRGLLLLSGGIDSPVAGIVMAIRGMSIDAVYFHTPPYTSGDAAEKTRRLAKIAGGYSMGIRLHTVNFTEVQKRIKEGPLPWSTILLRMAMMEAASILARRLKSKCLVTGESLSQVASQTVENLACSESRAALPVLRPLIGMDKEAITALAKQYGTYQTSILPHPDCCVLFSPPHPVLRGKPGEANELYDKLELSPLTAEALKSITVTKCGYYGDPA